ncbi:MAG: MATE family efflux transporter [Roseburia sp.]|nr:MATE family efflux transporter [Roseburia sp.]
MKSKNPLYQKLFHLVLPIAFQQFMLALVGASDALMLGRLHQNAMSAVSLASQVTFVFNLFMAAFVIGENMFTAQYYGKKDYGGISDICSLVLRISCIVAVFFMAGAVLCPESVMRILTNESELIVTGGEYLRCVGISYLLSAIAQVCLTLMKNCGAVSISTLISSMTVLLNIVLNAVFIFGFMGIPALGVQGAALATVIATAVQMLWSLFYVLWKMKPVEIHLFRKNGVLVKHFREKTGPVLLNELIWGGGFTMYSVIMGHLGTDAVAANGIANISKNLVVCLCLGLGSAGSIVVGNELGAGHFEEAKEAGKTWTRAAILCGFLSGALLLLLIPVIIRVVKLTPDARTYLRGMLIICSYYLIGKSINSMTIGGIFPAGGDSRFGLFCDTVTLWCITIPLGCLCAFVWKLPVLAVYFVLNLDEIVKLPVVYKHYKKYGWVKNIT